MTTARLSPHDERRVAVAAGVDPRTVRARLDPERRYRVHSTTAARVDEALRTLGIEGSTRSATTNPEPPAAV